MVSKNKNELLHCKYCGGFPKLSIVDMSSPTKLSFYYSVSCQNVHCDLTVNSYKSIFDAIDEWNNMQNKKDGDLMQTNTLYNILELLDPSQLLYLIINKGVFFHGTVSEIRYNVLDRIDINDYFVKHIQSYNSHLYLDLIYVGE